MPRKKKEIETPVKKKYTIQEFAKNPAEVFQNMKKTISIQEQIAIVNDVVKMCFDGDEYQPQYQGIATKINIACFYGNIEYSDMDSMIEFIYSDLYRQLVGLIDFSQLNDIHVAISDGIHHKKALIENEYTLAASRKAIDNLNTLVESIQDIVDKVTDFVNVNSNVDLNSLAKTAIQSDGSIDKDSLISTIATAFAKGVKN